MKGTVFCIAFLGLLATGSALQCFVCNSFQDPACEDEFPAESGALQGAFLKDCETQTEDGTALTPFCRKTEMNVYEANSTRIQRDCGYDRREGYDCYQKRSEDYVVTVCQCDEEMCNSANSLVFAPVLALLVPLFAKFL